MTDLLAAPVTAAVILDALVAQADGMIWCKELQFAGGARRCDFWTMEAQASRGYRATAYEIKVSRSDFKRDSHRKQRHARTFSDRFFYVTPVGLVRETEVPDWAGLVEYDGEKLKQVIAAPQLCKSFPSWELVVSLIRYNGEIRRDVGMQEQIIRRLRQQLTAASEKIRESGRSPWEFGIHE